MEYQALGNNLRQLCFDRPYTYDFRLLRWITMLNLPTRVSSTLNLFEEKQINIL